MNDKKCFIIMPISTPKEKLPLYSNDINHFKNIQDNLFIPVLEELGFNAIIPAATGAEVIHSRIIENLIKADLVLCDMSMLNPNVFFELGIRTSLGLPVCLVKDDRQHTIPFDTGIINYHTYNSELNVWKYNEIKESLKEHIRITFENNKSSNDLWDVFGLQFTDRKIENVSLEREIELLKLQNEKLKQNSITIGDRPINDGKAYVCSDCGVLFYEVVCTGLNLCSRCLDKRY